MKNFLKYLLWLCSFCILIIFYLFFTTLGHNSLGFMLGKYLSKKTSNKIVVSNLNLENYPQLRVDIKVNDTATVHLEGIASSQEVDMSYHLYGKRYHWNNFFIDSPLDIKGEMKGMTSNLMVEGEGRAFDGNITFSFIKSSKKFKDMDIFLTNAKSKEVLKFLKQEALIKGRVNIKSQFKVFSKYERDGIAHVTMRRAFMPSVAPYVPFKLQSTIGFKDMTYDVDGQINSDIGSLELKEGHYNKIRKEGGGKYLLHLSELSYFDEILKRRYTGPLDTNGSVVYRDGRVRVEGITDKFDGELKYLYTRDTLILILKKISLEKVLKQLNYPTLLTAKVDGKVDYNLKDNIMLIDTKLKEARFKRTKMTDMILKTGKINILTDVYNNSSFVAGYQNEQLTAVLKIANQFNHIYLNNATLNRKKNTIDSDFELKINGQEVFGRITGSLKHPSVSIDMKRLIKEQIKQRIDSFFGHGNIKNIFK